jgi:bifunctional non-homologous end joining protein LigD
MAVSQTLRIDGRAVSFTNLDKVLYPSGYAKSQVIEFYIRMGHFLLPHLRNRPVTLKRYPDGVTGKFFYEKDAPKFTPKWVKTYPVPRRAGGPDIRYILINDFATLAWAANLANLEIHPFLHRVPHLNCPTHVVFDLDPGEGAGVLHCAEVAFILKDVLDKLSLESFPKVSGSKGLQVHVPLNVAAAYAGTQPFAKAVAELLAKQHPQRIVSEMPKHLRRAKVFIDWSQNAAHKTTVGVYSLRAKQHQPFVSMPVTWDELKHAVKKSNQSALYFGPDAACQRLEKRGDLFAPVLHQKQKLPRDFMDTLATCDTRPARSRGKRVRFPSGA